jgi:hypothetical protein
MLLEGSLASSHSKSNLVTRLMLSIPAQVRREVVAGEGGGDELGDTPTSFVILFYLFLFIS